MNEGFWPASAMERAMKIQEVILRAMDGRLKWYQAAEILGISDRQMRRWKIRYERFGYDGLLDRRRRRPSVRRVPVQTVQEVLMLYRERYYDMNVLHFHEKLRTEHRIGLSYSWLKGLLQTAGLVAKEKRGGRYRKMRPRRPLPGMLLHTDASTHPWLVDQAPRDLIVVLDDATSEVYYGQFVPEESTRMMMAGLRSVVQKRGLFCSLYVDRASHFITTRTETAPHRPQKATELTQIGRALEQLGIELIPAHSPQARGRMERLWETWQGRLPQELRLAGITHWDGAHRFLKKQFIPYHNTHWTVPPTQSGSAFVPYSGDRLDQIFAVVHERVVANDNCVEFGRRRFQIPPAQWRVSFAKCRVKVFEHLDGTISIGFGPHRLGRFDPQGRLIGTKKSKPGGMPAWVPDRSCVLSQI